MNSCCFPQPKRRSTDIAISPFYFLLKKDMLPEPCRLMIVEFFISRVVSVVHKGTLMEWFPSLSAAEHQ